MHVQCVQHTECWQKFEWIRARLAAVTRMRCDGRAMLIGWSMCGRLRARAASAFRAISGRVENGMCVQRFEEVRSGRELEWIRAHVVAPDRLWSCGRADRAGMGRCGRLRARDASAFRAIS